MLFRSPAMFAWTWKDEPNLGGGAQKVYTATMAAWYYLSKSLDPAHFVFHWFYGSDWLAHYGTEATLHDWAESKDQMGGKAFVQDAIGFDIYPIYSRGSVSLNKAAAGPYSLYYDAVDRILGHNKYLVPFLPAINPSNRNAGLPDYQTHTEAQVYNEAWMNIIHGAKGLIWFAKFDNSSIRWPAMTKFYSEMSSLKDLVLGSPGSITVTDNSNEALNRVDHIIRTVDGTTLIVAARMTEPPPDEEAGLLYTGVEPTSITTTFTLSDGSINGDVEVYGEGRTVTATNGVFTDTFSKDDVNLYRYPAQAQVQAATQASVRTTGPPLSIKAAGTPMQIRGN